MNNMKSIGRIAAAGLLALTLVGCSGNTVESKPGIENIVAQAPAKPKFIEGKPVSVAQNYAHYYGSFSTVLNVGSNEILGFSSVFSGDGNLIFRYTQADALIQAQIAKGSNGFVRLHGEYGQDGIFNVKSVESGGYRVNF